MGIGVSSKVLEKEQITVFVVPKMYSFLLGKSTLLYIIKNFILKRKQGCINSY